MRYNNKAKVFDNLSTSLRFIAIIATFFFYLCKVKRSNGWRR